MHVGGNWEALRDKGILKENMSSAASGDCAPPLSTCSPAAASYSFVANTIDRHNHLAAMFATV